LSFPCSRLRDLLLAKHAFFLSESHNPNHSTGIHSRSMSSSSPLVPWGLFLSEYPLPSLVTGRGQVLLLSGLPIFLQTRPPLDTSYSLRRIRLLLSRCQPRRYWPCVCIFTNAVLPRLTHLLQTDGAGVDVLKQPFWAESLPRQQRSWIIMPSGRTPWV